MQFVLACSQHYSILTRTSLFDIVCSLLTPAVSSRSILRKWTTDLFSAQPSPPLPIPAKTVEKISVLRLEVVSSTQLQQRFFCPLKILVSPRVADPVIFQSFWNRNRTLLWFWFSSYLTVWLSPLLQVASFIWLTILFHIFINFFCLSLFILHSFTMYF